MKKAYLLIQFICFFSMAVLADDIVIPFGGANNDPAAAWKYTGGGTDLHATAWKTLSYNDASWATGNSGLGFFGASSIPPYSTLILRDGSAHSGASAPGAPYPTMYFRKVVNITNPSSYASFLLKTKADDGIVVYINGTQVFAGNINTPTTYNTFANGAASNNGADITSTTLSTSNFITGNNIISVEIHQNNAASSDLYFDMELTAVSAVNNLVIPFGAATNNVAAAWKYTGGGTDLHATTWKTLTYNDASWATGNTGLAFFGAGTIPPYSTLIATDGSANSGASAPGSPYPTMYFRKVVNIANPSLYAAFQLKTQADDAIVVYINGMQVFAGNINTPTAYSTLANSGANNNGADVTTTNITSSNFVAGDNIIAVEVHQSSTTSSDLFFDLELNALASLNPNAVRGPYLQRGNQTSIVVRWRTDLASDSRVTFGSAVGNYTTIVDDAAVTTEHSVTLNGLTADTKYFYTIGSTTHTIQSAASNYFLTAPLATTNRKVRIAALGDCGNASSNQTNVKNALLNYVGANDIDGVILMGDNAYYSGTDAEYQTGFFDMYKNDILKNKKLYPSPGNHDYGNSSSNTGNVGNTPATSMPYHLTFTVPTNGECGGVASNSKAYYSFDIGSVHFLSLDSYGQQNANTTKLYDTLGAQAIWVKNDLAANTKPFTVVYFHHPPYTKTSHDSDVESWDLGKMREDFIRILERYGVDLVICGHSHGFERSYLLKNYYKQTTGGAYLLENDFALANHTATGNDQNGKYDGTTNSCAYTYNSGQYNHGTMYIVAGSAGQIGGTSAGYPHNAMYYSDASNGGSLYFEADSNRLDAKFIAYTGSGAGASPLILDQFTIFKNVNKVNNITVNLNTALQLKASWSGSYIWPTNGNATSQSIVIPNSTPGTFTYTVKDAASNNCLEDVFNVTVQSVLPVQLTDFAARAIDKKVELKWITANEVNNSHFIVYKSTNGTDFIEMNRVFSQQTSAANYAVTDANPANGDNYYRLVQVDVNGRTTVLGVKKLIFKNNSALALNFINEGNNYIKVNVSFTKAETISLRIYNHAGQEILIDELRTNAGITSKRYQLAAGTYFCKVVTSTGEKISSKFIMP
jgi:predicted MPP superfamily phosphohydrolase